MFEQCSPRDVPVGVDRRAFLAASVAGLAALAVRPQASVAARSFELICKGAWGGQSATGSFHPHEIDRITIHHSAVVLNDNRDAPARVRAHQRNHQSLGWPDIAYHAVVDRGGNVYRGRPFWAQGDSGTTYDLGGHLLVMCEGNFESQRLTTAQLRSLVDVVAWACASFDVSASTIRGHRHYAATACPGRHLGLLVADGTIREAVQQTLDNGGVDKRNLCGEAGRRRVTAIEQGDA